MLRVQLRQLLSVLILIAAGVIGFGTGIVINKTFGLGHIGYSFIPASAAAVLAFWYFEFRLPDIQEARRGDTILKLAGSPASNLDFNDGSKGGFSPKGAIWLRNRGIAIGFDPTHQLARFVVSDSADASGINQDWVFGLETLANIEVREAPRRTLANRLRRLMGLQLKTAMMLHEKDRYGSEVDMEIYPAHVQKARDLVRQVNFHRQTPRAGHS